MSIDLQMGLIIAEMIDDFGRRSTKDPAPLDMFESAVVAALSETEKYVKPQVKIKPDIKKERQIIHSVADIRTELDMIQKILEGQQLVVKELLDDPKRDDKIEQEIWKETTDTDQENWKKVEKALIRLLQYQKRVKKIDKDAARIAQTMESTLNLKRTYASIEESQNSTLIGTVALAFGVITIIFTPLSFLASLYALPTVQLYQQQTAKVGDKSAYPS
ncbi:MAG: hypothetical protein M1814_003817 [Vezdaea aestivalis]|nr:MAG: hypothetical protein M1814_003817 [Vezdaea aestivalis]